MHVIINDRNKQYLVKNGSFLKVDSIYVKKGESFEFDNIVMLYDDNGIIVDRDKLDKIVVRVMVKKHIKDDKIVTIKFKRRKHYMKKIGHRQKYVILQVTYIGSK